MDYLAINKENWNDRTDVHYKSKTYDVPSFIEGRNSLKEIELPLLGNIQGKKILHLQCPFWSRHDLLVPYGGKSDRC